MARSRCSKARKGDRIVRQGDVAGEDTNTDNMVGVACQRV